MKKVLYFFKKVYLFLKGIFIMSEYKLDDKIYKLWVCVERPDGSTFNQVVCEVGDVPPKGIIVDLLEKGYFGKGYKVCNIWLEKK